MSKEKKKKAIVILGPTASGKTGLSLKLAQKFNGFIISADSRQIYKGMDIATAKITPSEKKLAPHYMIDIIKPDEDYSVGEFQKQALTILRTNQGLPLLVGGTGLYIQAVVDNLNIPKVPPDKEFRQKLEKVLYNKLYNKLYKIDPKATAKINPRNKRRVIRALEVYEKTGKPFSSWQTKKPSKFNFLQIGLDVPREKLNKRINQRVDQMINNGLVQEVETLREKYNPGLPSMSSLGYKEIGQYLDKRLSLKEATALLKQNTRRYAKKQISWFKRDQRVNWIKDHKEAVQLVKKFIEK